MAAIGARWAAAGIALGLALAAPGLTGLARADAPDPETTATTTAGGADPRGAATRAHTARTGSPAADSRAPRTPRAAAATGAADPRAGRATPIITPGAAHTPQTATPPADRIPQPAPVLLIDLPTAAAAGNDSGVTDAALTPVAQPQLDTLDFPDPGAPLSAPALITTAEPLTTLRSMRAPSAAPAPITTIQTALSAVAQQIDQVLNGLANWLSALPASPLTPVTDFLAGALQLVRRALTPVLRGVDGSYVSLSNRTDQTLAVVQVPNGGKNDPEADPRYLAPGETSDFSGYNSWGGLGYADVRLRIYTATQNDTGAWQKGEMREVITANNPALGRPDVAVFLDPYDIVGDEETVRNSRRLEPPFNRPWYDLDNGFKVGEAWFADYDTRGPIQSGQTGTFILRLGDRSDGYKAFQIEIFKIPTGATQDYWYGETYSAGRVNQK